MSRVQLALNVNDLDEGIEFYSKLFATQPAKVRPGYANFAVTEPPLKLILIENPAHGGTLNHLGVEVGSTDDVVATDARLRGEGLATAIEDQVTCCFAVQDKVWVDDPDGAPWEIYTVLADSDAPAGARQRRRTGLWSRALRHDSRGGRVLRHLTSVVDVHPASLVGWCRR